MDQDAFRRMMANPSLARNHERNGNKRPRDTAFGRGQGKRVHSSIPVTSMAPRHVRGADLARSGGKPTVDSDLSGHVKHAKSLLADGYVDRAKARGLEIEMDERQIKLEELKSLAKLKKISHREYLERVGALGQGDIADAGIVQGLDRKLLDRVRAGEDVFQTQVGVDSEEAEAALERALLDKTQASSSPGSSAEPSSTAPTKTTGRLNRDTLLASMKGAKAAQSDMSAKHQSKSDKFCPIVHRNEDGTTTESREENGRKIKIIRDSNGKILKKLTKKKTLEEPAQKRKSSIRSTAATSDETAGVSRDSKSPPKSLDVSAAKPADKEEEEEADIFEEAGTDYDPFASIDASPALPIDPTPRSYFTTDGDEEEEEEGVNLPGTAAEFLQQNRDALQRASAIVDRQAKLDQDRFAQKNAKSAGFGLVFRNAAYEADLQELPEDDEMYKKEKRTKGKNPEEMRDGDDSIA